VPVGREVAPKLYARKHHKPSLPQVLVDSVFFPEIFIEGFGVLLKFRISYLPILPHGPFLSVAADGHYGFQLGLFLGRYVEMPSDFMVRLDVDVKSEKLFTANMILLGGPGTNIITAMVNNSLSIKFPEHNYWAGVLTPRQTYTSEFVGIVAKTPNPFNPQKTVITLAGPRAAGTKAAVVALTQKWEELLSEYDGREKWAAVVQGLDLDGDGKIDSVEVLETA